jgi:hypothetical protein
VQKTTFSLIHLIRVTWASHHFQSSGFRRKDGCQHLVFLNTSSTVQLYARFSDEVLPMSNVPATEAAYQNETERLRTRVAELERERQIPMEIMEKSPVMISIVRAPDFIYELVNPAFQALAPGKESLGRRFAEVWAEVSEPLVGILQNVINEGETFTSRWAIRALGSPLANRRPSSRNSTRWPPPRNWAPRVPGLAWRSHANWLAFWEAMFASKAR